MSIRIQDNHMALQSQRHFASSLQETARATERLSTGYRINNAGDDAAGLHISTNLQAQIRGTKQAISNTQDAINFLNVADGVYNQVTDMTQRIRELVVQAANDTYDASSRQAMADEVEQLVLEIERAYDSAYFGDKKVFDTGAATREMQIGPNSDDSFDLFLNSNLTMPGFGPNPAHMWVEVASIPSMLDTHANASTSLGYVDDVMVILNRRRNGLGVMQRNLDEVHRNLLTNQENLSATNSRLQDADVASESLNLIQSQIKQNSAAAMLTQANGQNAQIALSLMGA